MGVLPSAPVRFARRPSGLLLFALASAITASASLLGASATARIETEVNAHWRGAYDILVRPHGARAAFEATGGVVEPNFVGVAGQGGITSAQVAAIRAVRGVEVAAPIAWVGLVTTATTAPAIEIATFPLQATLYKATVDVSTSDGFQTRRISSDTVRILIIPAAVPGGRPTVVSDTGAAVVLQMPDGRWVADVSVGHAVPQLQSPIIAVDPVAERQLLGDTGRFLDPLAQLASRDSLTIGQADPAMVLPGYAQGSEIAFAQQNGGHTLDAPVIPVLVSRRTYAPLAVSAEVSQIGHVLDLAPEGEVPRDVLASAAEMAGPGTTAVGSSAEDWSGRMRAFRVNGVGVAWPGTKLSGAGLPAFGRAARYRGLVLERPSYSRVAAIASDLLTMAYRVAPQGLVPPGGPVADDWVAPGAGSGGPAASTGNVEQSYRLLRETTIPAAAGFSSVAPGDAPFLFAPIGEYDLAEVNRPQDPLAYVPLGVYDSLTTTLVADAQGRPVVPSTMSATLNPVGLLTVPPMGIVDIHGAELLRSEAPIDAVRVRISGISDYGPAALDKVGRIAGEIAAMGLDVDVVAASSPQMVAIYVPSYVTTTNPPRDLGWINQGWTTLGAAGRVELGLTSTTLELLLLSLIGLCVVIGSLELIWASVRATEAGILFGLGWGRRHVIRWQAAESAAAGLGVGMVGTIAWVALGARDPLGLVPAICGGTVFAVVGAVGAALARSSRPVADTTAFERLAPRASASSIRGYAWRSAVAHPRPTAAVVIALSLAAGTGAPALAAIAVVSTRVGPTLLAATLAERLGPYQIGLVCLIALTALACATSIERVTLRSRQKEDSILLASGWTPRDIASLHRWRRILMAIPTVPIACVVATLGVANVSGDSVAVVLSVIATGGAAIMSPLVAGRLASVGLATTVWGTER